MADLPLSPADLLARALQLPPLPVPPRELPPGVSCAISGVPIRRGYPVADVVGPATTEFLDVFRGGVAGYVSDAAARCLRATTPRGINLCARSYLVFSDGTCYAPLIAREAAAAQGRGCWSEVVRTVWPARAGQPCLVLLTTDTRRRLWPHARVGALGPRTPVYLYDPPTAEAGVVWVDWPALLRCLDLVEQVYALGFPKAALRESLLLDPARCQEIGLALAMDWERALARWRGRPELRCAVLVAQRPLSPAPVAPAAARRRAPRSAPQEDPHDRYWQPSVC